jgi:hypothetical protein
MAHRWQKPRPKLHWREVATRPERDPLHYAHHELSHHTVHRSTGLQHPDKVSWPHALAHVRALRPAEY